jgi:hypothetical protein
LSTLRKGHTQFYFPARSSTLTPIDDKDIIQERITTMENTTGAMNETGTFLQDAARDAKDLADHAARQIGETLKSTAEQARTRVTEGGIGGQVAETVTKGIEQAATRLQEKGFGRTFDEAVAIARRYPVQAFAFGLGCVYLLSRLRRD